MSKRVLIVDDSPIIHALLRKTLENNGYEVCANAHNGKEGLQLFAQYEPDITFLDVTMPIMNGLQAATEIKKSHPDAKIIMLTAMGDDEIRSEADKIGIDAFLKKPFDDYKIISAISRLVDNE